MSNNKQSSQNFDVLRLKRAKQIIKAEIASYDLLSKPAKIRYERHVASAINDNLYGPEHGYVCGHNVSLCQPCTKCNRTSVDCIVYQVSLEAKLKDLLKQLKS